MSKCVIHEYYAKDMKGEVVVDCGFSRQMHSCTSESSLTWCEYKYTVTIKINERKASYRLAKGENKMKTGISTNTNEVRKAIQEHILDTYNIDDLKGQIDRFLQNGYNYKTTYNVAYDMVQDGCFLCYYTDVKDFLNGLGINPENKEYTNEKSWELYKHLVAINIERLVNNKGVK